MKFIGSAEEKTIRYDTKIIVILKEKNFGDLEVDLKMLLH